MTIRMTRGPCRLVLFGLLWIFFLSRACFSEADDNAGKPAPVRKVQRVLLIGQQPDNHPYLSHEYTAAMRLIGTLLGRQKNIQTIIVEGNEPWPEGPELIDGADAVVLFVSAGATWIHKDPARLEALKRLAARGGGFVGWHWGIGTREAEHIDEFVKLFGACHGGPDRKYKVVEIPIELADVKHPILNGIEPIDVHEEFYYTLKTVKPPDEITPLVLATIDGERHMVGWSWERPGGGRSFGFSGGHFHKNWEHVAYRRLMLQGILWTLGEPIPQEGLDIEIDPKILEVPKREKAKQK